jgi:hypothetical protein
MQVTGKLGPKNLILKNEYYLSTKGKEKLTKDKIHCA